MHLEHGNCFGRPLKAQTNYKWRWPRLKGLNREWEWKTERERQREGVSGTGGSQSWWLRRRWRLNSSRRAPLQLAHYPAQCLILALLIHQRECQGGRLSLSLSLSLLGPFGETFSDCVCIFNVAWPFGLFGRVGGARGTATMCTHFIHQCAAAQNDGNAKTNDDVCLSLSLSLRESLVENCLRWQVEEAMSVSCQWWAREHDYR